MDRAAEGRPRFLKIKYRLFIKTKRRISKQ